MRIYSSDINAYAREHRVSYQEAWRALVNQSSDSFTEKQPAVTKFSMKEIVGIKNMSDDGSVMDIISTGALQCPKYTVIMHGSGRALTFSETDLIKKG